MDPVSGSLRRTTTVIPPKGWTTDKEEMNYDYTWGDNDSDIQVMVKGYGLKPAHPIMCSTAESGNCMSIFQSGSKYYLWNPIEGAVWEIVTSMDLVDIITEIGKPRFGSLKITPIRQMSTYG